MSQEESKQQWFVSLAKGSVGMLVLHKYVKG